ncbi:MAG TPA: sugar transferase [Anaerolineales bacterium]|nr:sugar transferase [Anaerolineales bacterium]
MEREPIRIAGKQAGNVTWQHIFKGFILLSVVIFLLIVLSKIVQHFLNNPNMISWQNLILIMACCALLAWCLERIFSLAMLERFMHYRLAFWSALFAPFICAILLIFLAPVTGNGSAWSALFTVGWGMIQVVSFLGGFIGSVLASILSEGLWENNSQPIQETCQEVFQTHQDRLGKLPPIPYWKRLFDIWVALLGLLFSLPVWFLGFFLIWYEDPGPLFFVKNSVGRGGINFRQLKMRTMIRGAEDQTGPVISQRDDMRILKAGRFFRKTALDELPQLLNILRGEMSFVGPRPQRTILVQQYLIKMPEYAERHQVLPGLSGLAQVAGDYYLTPRQKLRLDRLYIRYMSFGFDLKLLFLAFLITFWYRWQKNWNGRLPRTLLRFGR